MCRAEDRNCDRKDQHSGTKGLLGTQWGPGFDGDTPGPAAAQVSFPYKLMAVQNQVPLSAPSTQAGHNSWEEELDEATAGRGAQLDGDVAHSCAQPCP